MELKTVRDSFEREVEKRELSSVKWLSVVNTMISEVEQALSRVQSLSGDTELILRDLKWKLDGPKKNLEELESWEEDDICKHVELLEEALIPDLTNGYRAIDFDVQILNQIIADHFFSQRLIDLGHSFMNESGTPEANVLRSHFSDMYLIQDALRNKNSQPLRDWISANHGKLQESGSSLEMELHKVEYVELLKQENKAGALEYAKAHFPPFASHQEEIKELVTCLLWIGELETCLKSQLLARINWENLANAVTHHFRLLAGWPCRPPPLTAATEAGSEALPTILKAVDVMQADIAHDWQAKKQLPFPVDLSKRFQFHSRFICPVTRNEISYERDVPMW